MVLLCDDGISCFLKFCLLGCSLRYIIPETVIPIIPGWSPDRHVLFAQACLGSISFFFLSLSYFTSRISFPCSLLTMLSLSEFTAASQVLPQTVASHPRTILPPISQDQAHEEWVMKWSEDAVSQNALSRLIILTFLSCRKPSSLS